MGAIDLSLTRVNLKTKFKKMKKLNIFGQPLDIASKCINSKLSNLITKYTVYYIVALVM